MGPWCMVDLLLLSFPEDKRSLSREDVVCWRDAWGDVGEAGGWNSYGDSSDSSAKGCCTVVSSIL